MSNPTTTLKLVVLLSGKGTNFIALANAIARGNLPHVELQAVISNRPSAPGIVAAQQRGYPTAVIDHTQYESRAAFDQALAKEIDHHHPDYVLMCGFMRILTPEFVQRYFPRLLNQHPSLLPRYPGLNTHARALADGCTTHGASIHMVTENLDSGPVLMQISTAVRESDTPDTLAGRVLQLEHRMLVEAVRLLSTGDLVTTESGPQYLRQPLQQPIQLDE